MISAIIFSKDRACQLRLLLESMFLHSYKIFDSLTVIYTASSIEFDMGYVKLQGEDIVPRIKIDWVQQQDLTKDVNKAMSVANKPDGFITFFTDDSIFYRTLHDQKWPIEACLNPGSDIACFSLRLGLNTTEQMYWQPGNTLKLRHARVGKLIKWKHTEYPLSHGYGYPLSLDGHIFRADQITLLVQQLGTIQGVNWLEGNLAKFRFEIAPCMASFAESALVVVPINRVQDSFPNIAGIYHGISPVELNQRYLSGEVVDYDKIDFSRINGTHQELAYSFRRL
jgi:hypothetical protein